ncbi:MAG: PilZ domain-containing protein [Syntrophobacterales bacterium]|nr:MAG: PilZ domain-containing protein [Syntrophobacterales bacterium]
MMEERIDISDMERRRFQRFTIELPLDYARLERKRLKAGIAGNASEGGLMVYMQERMKIGTKLYVALLFSMGFELTGVKALSQVMWKDAGLEEGWGRYKYGLKFLKIADEDLHKLKKLQADLAIQS